ncbi:single-stranded DNA-binding protein [Weissella diestrammenae]|uniref:Single-stranded DNA-binding protein n=1 Tax=Weissella diestrammenae TaxID=1162633 RepID=A0A7G9T6P1_9LACO|nr:single-stranded DNA-binding protein [Weissella diestrammenae]MCM0582949.1 single-stranded DNA-binding protein [Weissella diestrammenae]QNN75766.1 single-stranded DNA-binding protein [Weissella diestrammenae]
MNRVVLVGRLARDVELRYTQSGTAVGSFSIAVDRRRTNQNGERETDFFNATIWQKAAENFANFTSKGSRVAIEGRLQTSSYQNQQGQTVYRTEVIVENFDLLETRAESEARRANGSGNNNANNFGGNNGGGFNAAPAENPFGNPAATNNNGNVFGGANNPSSAASSNNDPFGGGQEIDISDDDLPF